MTRADLIPPLYAAALLEPEVLGAPRFPALEVYNIMLVQSVAHVPDTPLRLLAQNTQTSTADCPMVMAKGTRSLGNSFPNRCCFPHAFSPYMGKRTHRRFTSAVTVKENVFYPFTNQGNK
jgi:hypothetical protein